MTRAELIASAMLSNVITEVSVTSDEIITMRTILEISIEALKILNGNSVIEDHDYQSALQILEAARDE